MPALLWCVQGKVTCLKQTQSTVRCFPCKWRTLSCSHFLLEMNERITIKMSMGSSILMLTIMLTLFFRTAQQNLWKMSQQILGSAIISHPSWAMPGPTSIPQSSPIVEKIVEFVNTSLFNFLSFYNKVWQANNWKHLVYVSLFQL